MTKSPKVIRIGHSPDPDDAFMFFGFASGQVQIEGHEIENVLRDIQSLNEIATSDDPLEVTALSVHAFLGLRERYELLEVGTSVGRNYGPRVVARKEMNVEDLKGKKIALPGAKTTATLVARGLLPPFEEVHYDFDKIIDVVNAGEVDAGVLIHEGQLTYASHGLKLIADLGVLFSQKHDGLPLPLGVNCVLKALDSTLKKEVSEAYRTSVRIALTQRIKAVDYSMEFGRGLARELADKFVGMYVNEDSLHFNAELKASLDVLEKQYWNKQTDC